MKRVHDGYGGAPSAQQIVIFPSVELSAFSPEGPRDRAVEALAHPRVLMFSRVEPEGKGTFDGIEAFGLLREAKGRRWGSLIYSHPPIPERETEASRHHLATMPRRAEAV